MYGRVPRARLRRLLSKKGSPGCPSYYMYIAGSSNHFNSESSHDFGHLPGFRYSSDRAHLAKRPECSLVVLASYSKDAASNPASSRRRDRRHHPVSVRGTATQPQKDASFLPDGTSGTRGSRVYFPPARRSLSEGSHLSCPCCCAAGMEATLWYVHFVGVQFEPKDTHVAPLCNVLFFFALDVVDIARARPRTPALSRASCACTSAYKFKGVERATPMACG